MDQHLPPLQRPGIQSPADIPRAHARSRPDHPALVFEGRVSTYRQWDQRCSQAAQALMAALPVQGRCAYLAKNADRFFDLYMAAAKSRRVLVAVNWRLAPPEIAFILDDAEAELVFVDQLHAPVLQALRGQLPRVRMVVCIDGPADGCIGYDDWLAPHAPVDPALPALADDTVLQMYTSGTTGMPKGVQMSNRNLVGNLSKIDSGDLGPWREDDIALAPLPQFHVGGAGYGLYPLYAGGTCVILREANAALILQAFRELPITKMGLVPAVMGLILNHPDCATADFSRLDTVTYGASPIPVDLLERALATFKCGFVQMFGMTESTSIGTVLSPSDHDPQRPQRLTSCGRPATGVELKIAGADGVALPAGETGEILLRGHFITKGYWRKPEATAAAIRDGWYHTGDAGYVDAEGYLYLRDRIKDMVISGGENVYPAEVESALSRHPGIADVAVIGVPDDKWGEAVKAVVVPRAGHTLDPQEVLAFARQHIAGFKCPKSIDIVEALPRNASGKLLKRVLREPDWQGRTRSIN
ncbi:MAG: long-chain-fatty-acid--CoA ligase [Burkholderiales bacterium]